MMQVLLQRFMRDVIVNPSMALRACLLLAAVLVYGTTGFLYFELPGNPDLTWQDALWYCLVTLTTVGYGDFFPKTAGGRFLVGVPLLVLGVGLLGFMLSVVATALITARNKELKGMNPARTRQHVLVVHHPGAPKLLRLMDELMQDPAIGPEAHFVLVDPDLDELPAELARREVHFVRGDPTRDETLQRAGIDRASHALVLLRAPGGPAADALNVAVTLAIEARTAPGQHRGRVRGPGHAGTAAQGRLRPHRLCRPLRGAVHEPGAAEPRRAGHRGRPAVHRRRAAAVPDAGAGAAGAGLAALQQAAVQRGHVLLGVQRAGSNHLNPAPASCWPTATWPSPWGPAGWPRWTCAAAEGQPAVQRGGRSSGAAASSRSAWAASALVMPAAAGAAWLARRLRQNRPAPTSTSSAGPPHSKAVVALNGGR
jgi:voltage-gated potassium channel Kch